MIWADHVLAVVLAVLNPAAGVWANARLARRLGEGDAGARLRFYGWSIAEAWTLALTLVLLWLWTGRPIAPLGLVVPAGPAAWITAALCVATAIVFATQVHAAHTSDAARASVRVQLEASPGVRIVLPATAVEMRGFAAVSVTAGVCEELLYRGFLLWYVAAFLPGGWAIAATVAIFGVGHAYQGVRGMLLTAVVGGIAMAVYLWTGSLVAPIVMHATVDLANGFIAYRAGAATRPEPAAA